MSIIFPYEVNWGAGVEMDREYKTEIIESRNQTEQRKAQRGQPRRTVTFDVRSSAGRGEDIADYLEDKVQEPFWVPDPTRAALMGESAQIGDSQFVIKGSSGGASSGRADRSVYYLLDRSMSLTTTQFNAIKNAVLDGLVDVEAAIAAGNRVDLAVRFWSSGVDDVALERKNLSLASVQAFRDFIAATNRITGGDVDPAYTAALAWFQETKATPFAGRSLILVTDASSDDGFSSAASGPAADMLDRASGDFNIDNGNPVNCFAINYDQGNTTYTALLDNTAGDSVPVIVDGDTAALTEAFRRAAQSWTNTPQWLRAGMKVILGKGTEAIKELATVASVAGDAVTLDAPTAYEWPANTPVRMAMLGRVEQEVSIQWSTSTAGSMTFVFFEDPNESYEEVYRSQRNDRWYDGREVWLRKPNWREAVQTGTQGNLATLSFDRGVFDHRSHQPSNTRTWEATYSGMNSDAAEELIQFAHRKRGRRQDFWMPTWRDDMGLAAETVAGADTLTVNDVKVLDRHNGSDHMNRVIVLFHDGTHECNTVDSMTTALGDTVITMKNDWSRDLTYSDVRQICWLPLWRMAVDTLSMIWPTNHIGEAKIAIQQMRADHTDDGYFPITTEADNGDHTYDVREYGLISTGDVLGSVALTWTETATKISDATDAEVTLNVTTQFYSEVLGSIGEQIGATVTHEVVGSGEVTLNFVDDIPARTAYVKLNYTKTATLSGDTAYGDAVDSVVFRGKP